MEYPKWHDTPACSGTDRDSWFPQGPNPTSYPNAPLLQRICSGCPVRQQCFDYALHHVVDGYWAGTTPKVRSRMRTRLGIVAQPVYWASQEVYGA